MEREYTGEALWATVCDFSILVTKRGGGGDTVDITPFRTQGQDPFAPLKPASTA